MKAGLLVEGGAVCNACAKHYRQPVACEKCGQMELALTAIETAEGRRRVCQRCWNRHHGFATCAVCRKYRRPAGSTEDGKPICKSCLSAGGQAFICPKCGQPGVRHSATRCMNCYQKDNVAKKVASGAALLRQQWTRDAWIDYGKELLADTEPLKWMVRVERHYLLFARLDAAFDRPTDITPAALLKAVGGKDGLRRFAIPYGYLVKNGAIPEATRALLSDAAETLRQDSILGNLNGKWYAPLLTRFRDHLMAVHARYDARGWKCDKSRMKPRTITLALRTARKFCETLEAEGVVMIQQVTPDHLATFLAVSPGLMASIRAFLRFINRKEKLFKPITVPTANRGPQQGIFLSRERYLALLKDWLSPADDALRESLIGLFMVLYAQRVKNTVQIKLEDLSHGRDGRYRIALGRAEIALDARVSDILGRYLEQRRALAPMDEAETNPYLFTGRALGEHITAAAVTYWLARAGVNAEQLFATAIYNAYLNGVRQPKVLVKAFGITPVTAVKYLNLIDPRLVAETERVLAVQQ